MKNNRAVGLESVPVELLKHAPQGALEILCTIFNECLGDISSERKIANMSSIYKKVDKQKLVKI